MDNLLLPFPIAPARKWSVVGLPSIIFVGIGVLSLALFSEGVLFSRPVETVSIPPPGLPVTLRIPSIHINASIERVGSEADGAVGTPKLLANAAWFESGPRPGEEGSAVIDGHFGWKDGVPAVFHNLHSLQPGDKVYVEDDRGRTIAFRVLELRTYGKDDDAKAVFGQHDGKAHLNLITCEGAWDTATRSYSERLVVFTEMTEN